MLHRGRDCDDGRAEVARLLRPGRRALNHGIARLRVGDPEAGPFSERFVFPDAAPLHLSTVIAALELAGLGTEHVEGFADDYAETLAHWARRLDARHDEAIALVGAERLRVWRLYLRVARNGFLGGFTGVYQTPIAPTSGTGNDSVDPTAAVTGVGAARSTVAR